MEQTNYKCPMCKAENSFEQRPMLPIMKNPLTMSIVSPILIVCNNPKCNSVIGSTDYHLREEILVLSSKVIKQEERIAKLEKGK